MLVWKLERHMGLYQKLLSSLTLNIVRLQLLLGSHQVVVSAFWGMSLSFWLFNAFPTTSVQLGLVQSEFNPTLATHLGF